MLCKLSESNCTTRSAAPTLGQHNSYVLLDLLGLSDDEISEFDPFFGRVSLGVELTNMLGVYTKIHADLGANGQIYGQLGLVQLKYDVEAEIFGESASESYDDIGVAFGFGASFGLSEQAAIVFEYNQYPDVDIEDVADLETTSLSVGVRVSF